MIGHDAAGIQGYIALDLTNVESFYPKATPTMVRAHATPIGPTHYRTIRLDYDDVAYFSAIFISFSG